MMRTLLGLLLCLCLAAPVAAATATVTQYDAALRQVQQALEARIPVLQAHETPNGEPPQFVARRVLAPIQSVGPVGGAQQPVHNGLLLQQLADADRRGDVGRMQALDRQIATLRAALAPAAPAPGSSAQDPVLLAHAVLARREFGSDPYPPPPLIDRLADWISRQLDKIHWPHAHPANTPNINLPSPNFGFIRGLLYVLLAGAAAVLVAVLVQLLSRRQSRARAPQLDAAEAALVEARDTDSLIALAERQAREGDYRRAFRLVYLATLIALDTGGVLRFNRSRTNWEYLRALRASGREDVYRTMLPLTRAFDRVWYGFAPAGPSEYADAVAQYNALLNAPAPPAEPAGAGV